MPTTYGSGLSTQGGLVTESTPGQPAAVSRFFEIDNETMQLVPKMAESMGLRAGGLVQRGVRHQMIAREATGDVTFDLPFNGIGLVLQHCFGTFAGSGSAQNVYGPTLLSGSAYQQIHNYTLGTTKGNAATWQFVKPDTSAVLGPETFTYPGAKVTAWEFTCAQGGYLKAKLSLNAMDEVTPAQGFASTTLASGCTSAATSISTAGTIAAGNWLTIDPYVPALAESLQVASVAGTGPYTVTFTAGQTTKYAHSSGATVGSLAASNYTAQSAALQQQAASYTASNNLWRFDQGAVIAGGTTSVVSNVWTQTGGVTVANVRAIDLKGTNPLKTDRWGAGSQIKSEQLENGFRQPTGSFDVEYNGRAFYDAYAANQPLALVCKFTGPVIASTYTYSLSFYYPYLQFESGTSPQVAGPDIIIQKLPFRAWDDGTNGALQVVLQNTDAAF